LVNLATKVRSKLKSQITNPKLQTNHNDSNSNIETIRSVKEIIGLDASSLPSDGGEQHQLFNFGNLGPHIAAGSPIQNHYILCRTESGFRTLDIGI